MTSAERGRKFREECKRLGLCTTCGKRPPEEPQLNTCDFCRRQRRRRYALKGE